MGGRRCSAAADKYVSMMYFVPWNKNSTRRVKPAGTAVV